MTDPAEPREAIVHQILGDARALAATATRLFQTGLVEYEAVGRRWPIKTAELDIPAHAAIVALQNHIVVAGGAMSFVDVSTPGEPVLMATIDLRPNYVQDMAAVDDYLYVTTGRDGLLVISGWE